MADTAKQSGHLTLSGVVTDFQNLYKSARATNDGLQTHYADFIFSNDVLKDIIDTTARRIRAAHHYQKHVPDVGAMPWDKVYTTLMQVALKGPVASGVSDTSGAVRYAMSCVLKHVVHPVYANAQFGGSFGMARRPFAQVQPGVYRDPTLSFDTRELDEGARVQAQIQSAVQSNRVNLRMS